MNEIAKSAPAKLKEWWGVVIVAVGVLGGYLWLDSTFAKIEKLEAERCRLTYRIRYTRADIDHERYGELTELLQAELAELEKQVDLPETPRIQHLRDEIVQADERTSELRNQMKCLQEAQQDCLDGDTSLGKCQQ